MIIDMKKKVLITSSSFGVPDASPIEKLKDAGLEIIKNQYGRKLLKKELEALLPGIEMLIAGLEELDRSVLEKSNLKVISRCGAGLSNIDLEAARALGIAVFNTPDAPTEAVAEMTVGAMLSLRRPIPRMNAAVHDGRWEKMIGAQLEGSAVAIIGFGRIGRRVAELLRPFNVHIIAVDTGQMEKVKDIEVLSLEEALPKADVITIHISGDSKLLDKKQFAIMKKGVFLLNCARGSIIDEPALTAAIKNGQVGGAWLDCFKEEPYKGPLAEVDEVIMTPHAGSYTAACRLKMEMEAVDNVIRFLRH